MSLVETAGVKTAIDAPPAETASDAPTRRTVRRVPAPALLTDAQRRALQRMATPDADLRGISWTTARALRSLGLCELGPGRRGRLTGKGIQALVDLEPANDGIV